MSKLLWTFTKIYINILEGSWPTKTWQFFAQHFIAFMKIYRSHGSFGASFKTVGRTVQTVGRSFQTVGRAVQTVWRAVQTAWRAVQTAWRAVQIVGRAVQTVWWAVQMVGRSFQTLDGQYKRKSEGCDNFFLLFNSDLWHNLNNLK